MKPPVIHLKDIPDDGLDLEFPIARAWMDAQLVETGIEATTDPAGKASVRLQKQGRDVLLNGSLDTAVRTACVRCLEPIDVKLHADFVLLLEPASSKKKLRAHEEIELTSAELDVDYYVDDRVDVGHWIREQILLEAPAYPECEGGCKVALTSATQPPTTATIDPRLLPLKKLTNKEN